MNDFKLIRSRRRTIGLQIQKDATLIIRAPFFASEWTIEKAIREKQSWIEKTQKRMLEYGRRLPAPKPFSSGETFPFLGKEYPLEIKRGMSKRLVLELMNTGKENSPLERGEGCVSELENHTPRLLRQSPPLDLLMIGTAPAGQPPLSRGESTLQEDPFAKVQLEGKWRLAGEFSKHAKEIFVDFYKEQAMTWITPRAKQLAERAGVSFKKIKINGAKTRWGSCSQRGGLNFSWRVMMAPPEVVQYVIAHEVAHLKQPNHSRNFWREVEGLCPDYRRQETWLKRHGDHLVL